MTALMARRSLLGGAAALAAQLLAGCGGGSARDTFNAEASSAGTSATAKEAAQSLAKPSQAAADSPTPAPSIDAWPGLPAGTQVVLDAARQLYWLVSPGVAAIARVAQSAAPQLTQAQPVGSAWARLEQVVACHLGEQDLLLIGSSNGSADTDQAWVVFDCATGAVWAPAFVGAPRVALGANADLQWSEAAGCATLRVDGAAGNSQWTFTPPAGDARGSAWAVAGSTEARRNA